MLHERHATPLCWRTKRCDDDERLARTEDAIAHRTTRSAIAAAPHPTKQIADGERREGDRVRPLLDGRAYVVLDVARALPGSLCSLGGGVLRLTVEVLRGALGLPHPAPHLGTHVTRYVAVGFLCPAAQILSFPCNSVVCHCGASERIVTLSTAGGFLWFKRRVTSVVSVIHLTVAVITRRRPSRAAR